MIFTSCMLPPSLVTVSINSAYECLLQVRALGSSRKILARKLVGR